MAGRQSGTLTDDLSHVEFETSEDVEVVSTFDSMHLREDLVRGIYSYGKSYNNNYCYDIQYFVLDIYNIYVFLMIFI